jgi:uncharacterized radical SAM superfamily Fe-S cluster-containing enzyme
MDGNVKILSKTQSLCPVCFKPVEAFYEESGGRVYFRKSCPEHGGFSVLAAENAEDYAAWTRAPVVNVAPRAAITEGRAGECPLHCGTCGFHLQTACCVLLDVTERCNQRCPWCFARAGENAGADPGLSEIEAWYDRLLELGEERTFNIQISGGEPTVRGDLPELVRMGREKGFEYIQLNTNGRRLALEDGYAALLKEAGASVAFMQFDGTRDGIYETLRGEPLLELKLRAIENCRKARLPVTLVPTLVKGVNTDDLGGMIRLMLENLDVIKGVHFQPASFFGRRPGGAGAGRIPEAGGEPGGAEAGRIPGADGESAEAGAGGRVTMFEILRGIEEQTDGLFSRQDLLPISTGHPLCCFSGSFLKEKDGGVRSLMTARQREDGLDCCCGEPDPLDIIRKDRDFVLNRWDIGDGCDCAAGADPETDAARGCGCGCDRNQAGGAGTGGDEPGGADADAMSFDAFLNYVRLNRFTLTGMAFQDADNLDAERLKRCRVQVFTRDERLIPFCAYNSIYRQPSGG